MTKDHLNKVRAAIIALDRAANRLPIVERSDRLLHTELQDAADGLVEVREEIQVRLEAEENANRLFTRGI
jgi:hypothetical protein